MIEAISKQAVTLIPNKSIPGLIALLESRADMAMISSSLQSELEELRRIRPGLPYDQLQAHEILNTRVAFAVHPSNPVRTASLDQVRQMLLGQIGNWADLGGPDLPVKVVLVGGGGGVTTLIESRLLNGHSAVGPHVIYVKTPLQVIKVVQQLPGAVGFAQLMLTKSQGLPELRTEKPIDQMLSLVTLGSPTTAMSEIIRAARQVAQKAI
jgi:phosphate transport system substrate-binding protein